MSFTMFSQIMYTSVLGVSQQEMIEYADDSDAAASCLEFLGILLGGFFVAGIILIGIMIFRNRKRRRLTNPHKDYYR